MAKKNPLIEELRELGVSDYQRRKLRELQRELEQDNTYKKISDLNEQLMGERVKPITLSYETAIRLLRYNMYGNIQGIIREYETAKINVEQGTTTEYESYINTYSEELQDMGVYNATPENLKKADLRKVEFYADMYNRYKDIGNSNGTEYARQELIKVLGA